MDQPTSVSGPPRSFPMPPPKGGHSTMTLVFTGIAALMLGVIMGVLTMMFMRPSPETSGGELADASASATATDAATAAPAPKPQVDPKAAAAAAKLAKLRKKVKRVRSKQVDPECAKYFKGKYPAGHVFDGGKFVENQYVANASGCVAVAKAAKAPWFCCPK